MLGQRALVGMEREWGGEGWGWASAGPRASRGPGTFSVGGVGSEPASQPRKKEHIAGTEERA